MEPYLLTNKTALVTGAAQGIGLAIATALARRGASVGIVDLKGAEEAAASLASEYPDQRFAAFSLDVRDGEEVTAAVGSFVSTFGGLDILVNNAGTAARIGIDEITAEQWQRDIETNLGGTFNFIKAAVHPHMCDAGRGSIINTSSISGINGGAVSDGEAGARSGPAYAASKGGIIALTKWVARNTDARASAAIRWHRGRSNQRSPSVRLMTPQGRLSIGWASRMRSPRRSPTLPPMVPRLRPDRSSASTAGPLCRERLSVLSSNGRSPHHPQDGAGIVVSADLSGWATCPVSRCGGRRVRRSRPRGWLEA